MPDFNMVTGRIIRLSLFSMSSKVEGLPSSIQDIRTRARLVDGIDKSISKHFGEMQIFALPQSTFDSMMRDMSTMAEKHIKDVDNTNARNGVASSVWSGCLSAAKEIALGTRNGENTPESRREVFTKLIDPLCKVDELFKAGVEAAPVFKRLRGEEVKFEGVPESSPARMYKDTSYP
jgi:hypothetical protein